MAEENESRKNDVRARALQGAEGGSVVTFGTAKCTGL